MTFTTKNKAPSNQVKQARRDIYQEVTDIIIRQLEKGTIPWQQPWHDNNDFSLELPQNANTRKHYRGVNIVLLWAAAQEKRFNCHEWATFKQWHNKEEAIRKGEKGTMIVYYDTMEKEDDQGDIQKIHFLKQSVVFNKAQLVSYDPPKPANKLIKTGGAERIEAMETFIANTGVIIEQPYHKACYNRQSDKIFMPDIADFTDMNNCSATEGYYSTLLHELTHWTSHAERLNRNLGKRFGDKQYAIEELVAELGAAFACTELGISKPHKDNHAAYIASWLKVLRENKYAVVAAASEASKAVEYLYTLQPI